MAEKIINSFKKGKNPVLYPFKVIFLLSLLAILVVPWAIGKIGRVLRSDSQQASAQSGCWYPSSGTTGTTGPGCGNQTTSAPTPTPVPTTDATTDATTGCWPATTDTTDTTTPTTGGCTTDCF